MIPKITVFVSNPSTELEDKTVKKFLELKFAPLVDANHGKLYQWFINNVKGIPHKLFSIQKQNIFFFEADDLNSNMDFGPLFMINFNQNDKIDEYYWQKIREWLIYNFFTCYDHIDYLTDDIKRTDEFMERPFTNVVALKNESPIESNDHYGFKTHHIKEKDTMLYEIQKPNTDLPYTAVIRRFSERGHRAFFPSLYICQSWGVSRYDLPFLSFIWKQLNLEGEFDMDAMLKEAVERCYPSPDGVPEPEPEVYRRAIPDVLSTLQFQQDGIQCGHLYSDIPEEIRNRFT